MIGKAFYIARNKASAVKYQYQEYFWYEKKRDAKYDSDGCLPVETAIRSFGAVDHESIFGIKLKPGEVKKVRVVDANRFSIA